MRMTHMNPSDKTGKGHGGDFRRCGHSAWQMDHLHDTPSPAARGLIIATVAWSLAWKGASLWRAARDDNKPWFATLLISNTLGILDAVYLFGVSAASRRKERDEKPMPAETGEPVQLENTEEM